MIASRRLAAMNLRLLAGDDSLQTPVKEDGADWQETIVDDYDDQEMQLADRENASGTAQTLR